MPKGRVVLAIKIIKGCFIYFFCFNKNIELVRTQCNVLGIIDK